MSGTLCRIFKDSKGYRKAKLVAHQPVPFSWAGKVALKKKKTNKPKGFIWKSLKEDSRNIFVKDCSAKIA